MMRQRRIVFVVLLGLSLATLVNGCFRRRKYRDRTPPTMSCPGDRTEPADKMQVNTKVYWTEPEAHDEKDGKIIPRRTGPGPGQIFSENADGTTITYTATDRSGNYRSCDFKIFITVTRCNHFDDITDGWKICHPSNDMRRGGTCKFGCYEGHELQGDSRVTCQDSGLWTNEMQPYCKKLTCNAEDILPIDLQTRVQCSDDSYYRSICTYSCVAGYDVLPGKSRVKVCTKYGIWNGRTPECVDIEPPKFQNCPSIKKAYADRSRTTGRVWWDDPGVSDNSGVVHLKQTVGPTSGDDLEVGQYTVTYIAYDEENNTAECTFDIIVKQILCPSVYPLPYTSVVCPSGRIFGSSCKFSCDNGTAINGDQETQCEKQGVVHYYGRWTFGNNQPYCELTSLCPDLFAPADGALACDVWMDGRFCQAFCRDGYLFGSKKGRDLFRNLLVCGDSGTWSPASDIPDCVPTRRSIATFKLSAVYYYDGPCESAIQEIKEKFISRFMSARGCEEPGKCTVENVEVECGVSSGRKRREAQDELTISADISVQSSSSQDAATEVLQQRQEFKNALKNNNDTSFTFVSETVSAPSLECPDGFEPNYQEYQCAECSKGYYQDSHTNSCEKCPFGQYQPISGQTTCLLCPPVTTTVKMGAYDETQCEVACNPGYFSDTGAGECSPCDIGYYTTKYGTRECIPCPGEKISKLGTKDVEDCYDFDLEFKDEVTDPAYLTVPIQNVTDELDIRLWVFCKECKNILAISESNISLVAVSEEDAFVAIVNSQTFQHERILSVNSLWKYIRIALTRTSVSVTVNGEDIIHEAAVHSWQLVENTELEITVGGAGFSGSVSHCSIWTTMRNDQNMSSPKCVSEETGDLFSWLQFADIDGDFVQAISKCDDFNNCLSDPCQHGGVCTDALNTYQCSCLTGFTGISCETNIDDCQDHACDNGATCVDNVAGYDCLCPDGFKGPLCEIKVVHGSWSVWDDRGPCSQTCGTGSNTRYRTCSNPAPDNGGHPCEGEAQETSECETDVECLKDCEFDPTLENGDVNCTTTNATRVCNPFCNEGYDFDTDMYLDAVVCGRETGFTWNIKTEDNPTGQLPTCKEIQMAKSNTMQYIGPYLGFDTDLLNDAITTNIRTIVADKVAEAPCVQSGRCVHFKTEVGGYNGTEENNVSFIAYISCDPDEGTDDCFNLLKEVKEMLDGFVQQLAFSVNVSSTTYNVDYNSTSIDGVSVCESGTVPVFYYCIPCGEGTYQLDDFCERCPRGTYQDEVGMTSCKDCPVGSSTLGLMSRDKSLCNVAVDTDEPSETLEIWMIVLAVVIPALLCCIIVTIVIYYCSWKLKKQRQKAIQWSKNIQREPTFENRAFDQSGLFSVKNPSEYGCDYPEPLRQYSTTSPPPVYERPPQASKSAM